MSLAKRFVQLLLTSVLYAFLVVIGIPLIENYFGMKFGLQEYIIIFLGLSVLVQLIAWLIVKERTVVVPAGG